MIQKIKKLIRLDDGLEIKFNEPMVCIVPNEGQQHLVSVKTLFEKHHNENGVTDLYNVKTEVFDSALQDHEKNIGTLINVNESFLDEKELEEYIFSHELGFYYALLAQKIVPAFGQNLTEKSKVNIVSTTLNHSVLYQGSPNDNTCGINAAICCLLMMNGGGNLCFYQALKDHLMTTVIIIRQ